MLIKARGVKKNPLFSYICVLCWQRNMSPRFTALLVNKVGAKTIQPQSTVVSSSEVKKKIELAFILTLKDF